MLQQENFLIKYVGDDSTTVFNYGFRVDSPDELKAYLDGVAELGVSVTVNPGTEDGGTATFDSPPALDVQVGLRRETPLQQSSDYSSQTEFPSETVETDMDESVMRDQETDGQVANCMQFEDFGTQAMDAQGKIVTNGADGVDDTDLVTLQQARNDPDIGSGLPGPAGPQTPYVPFALTTGESAAGLVDADINDKFLPGWSERYVNLDPTGVSDNNALIAQIIASGEIDIRFGAGTFLHSLITTKEGQTFRGLGREGVTIFKLLDGVVQDKSVSNQTYGITCETALNYVGFHSFEYDGNGANNMGWWGGTAPEFGDTEAHGVGFPGYLTGGPNRVQPKQFDIYNIYVHDTVRNGLMFGANAPDHSSGFVDNVRIENSRVDHAIYCDGTNESVKFGKVEVNGYARQGLCIFDGTMIDTILFRSLANNPEILFPVTAMIEMRVDMDQPTMIDKVNVELFDPSVVTDITRVLSFVGRGTVNSLAVSLTGGAPPVDLALIYANAAGGVVDGAQVNNVSLIGGFERVELLKIQSNATPVKKIQISHVRLEYDNGTKTAGAAVMNCDGAVEDLTANDLKIYGDGPEILITTANFAGYKRNKINDVFMENAGADALNFVGASLTNPIELTNIQLESISGTAVSIGNTGWESPNTQLWNVVTNDTVGAIEKRSNISGVFNALGAGGPSQTIPHGLGRAPVLMSFNAQNLDAATEWSDGKGFQTADPTNLINTVATNWDGGTTYKYTYSAALPGSEKFFS